MAFLQEEEDELFFDDDEYFDRMEAALKRNEAVERSLQRSQPVSYVYLHGHRKKTTGDVLDDIEYFNSAKMVKASVNRLYQPKATSPTSAAYLTKGSRENAKDKARRVVPKDVPVPVPVSTVKPHKVIKDKCQELHDDHKLHRTHVELLQQQAANAAIKPSKWNGERKLKKTEVDERVQLLYKTSATSKMTERHLREWVEANPVNASNVATYKHMASNINFNGRKVIPNPDAPEIRETLPGGPWRQNSWKPSGRHTSTAMQTFADHTTLVGGPGPTPNEYTTGYDKDDYLHSTASVRQKKRDKCTSEGKIWK